MVHTWGVGVISTLIVLGVVDDLRSRKYHKTLFLFSFAAILCARLSFDGLNGTLIGLSAAALTFLVGLRLWKFRVLGAGDIKLFIVIAAGLNTSAMTWIFSEMISIYFDLSIDSFICISSSKIGAALVSVNSPSINIVAAKSRLIADMYSFSFI